MHILLKFGERVFNSDFEGIKAHPVQFKLLQSPHLRVIGSRINSLKQFCEGFMSFDTIRIAEL